MARTPEALVAVLQAAHGRAFVAAFVHGSAARGDHHHTWSDVNLVVIVRRVDPAALRRAAPAVRRWEKRGNPPPLLMSPSFLRRSADVYPLEWTDILETRRVLAGPDPLRGLRVSRFALRQELERELKSAWLRLLGRLQVVVDDRRALRDLLVHSSSTFLVLFRGCLRLVGRGDLPPKEDAARALGLRWGFSPQSFDAIRTLRDHDGSPDLAPILRGYLAAIEKAVTKVDSWKRN